MSEIRAATISNLAGTGPVELTGQNAAKAGFVYNNVGTASVTGSFNVSSISDGGVGDFGSSFTNVFGANDYATFGMPGNIGASSNGMLFLGNSGGQTKAATACGFTTVNNAGASADRDHNSVHIAGDLA